LKAAFNSKELPKNFDIEKVIGPNMEEQKFLHFSVGNNENLSFKDDSFDCYIANLSLMLVDNPLNQLSEAKRVLKSGGRAAFTIWGRREKCN